MLPEMYEQMADVEAEHWWYVSRQAMVERYVRKLSLTPGANILDLGCGTGGNAAYMTRFGNVTGLDISDVALATAGKRSSGVRFVHGDANVVDELFPEKSFSMVTIFNVLYHSWIKDERDLLKRLSLVVKEGGYVLLTEPAFMTLFRKHDRLVLGKTRYVLADFKAMFREAGFEYVAGRYFNAVSFPVCLIKAWMDRVGGGSKQNLSDAQAPWELATPPGFINSTMKLYMRIEDKAATLCPIPFGVSLLAIGRKRK